MTAKKPPQDWGAGDKFVPIRIVAEELNVCVRTIYRWTEDQANEIQFPAPIILNDRRYFSRNQIDNWKASRVQISIAESVARADKPDASTKQSPPLFDW